MKLSARSAGVRVNFKEALVVSLYEEGRRRASGHRLVSSQEPVSVVISHRSPT